MNNPIFKILVHQSGANDMYLHDEFFTSEAAMSFVRSVVRNIQQRGRSYITTYKKNSIKLESNDYGQWFWQLNVVRFDDAHEYMRACQLEANDWV